MRSRTLVLLVCVALHARQRSPDPVPPRLATGFAAITEADLRANLSFVAGDGLQGRMSLQPGDDAAAEWVASEFAKAGLQPLAGGSFFQPVELIEYVPDRSRGLAVLKRGNVEKRWSFPEAYGSFPKDVDLSGQVVFAGYGISAPELAYDDYQGVDAKGKIVLIFDHEPQENDPHSIFNGKGNTRYATSNRKLFNAQAHGAIALMMVAEPNRKHPSAQERMARVGGSAARSVPIPFQALADDPIHIPLLVISDAVARELLSPIPGTPGDLQTAIDRELKPRSQQLPETEFSLRLRNVSTRRGVSQNVAGLLPGSDPTLSAETILLSAHHDHNGMLAEEIWHGADDNGSGTVGVVELAHAMAANPVKPKRSLLFAVFAAEERGLLGSYHMAAHPLRPLASLRAVLNFDMIGRDEAESDQTKGLIEIPADTTNRLNLIGGSYSPGYREVVDQENKRIGLVLDDRFDHDAALNIFFRSDQFPFVLHDIPSLWWFTGFHPDYHHSSDTADKIDYRKMAQILRLAYLTAFHLGDEAETPRFVPNPRGE